MNVLNQIKDIIERAKGEKPATTAEIRRMLGRVTEALYEINVTNELKNTRNQKTWQLALELPEFIKRVK